MNDLILKICFIKKFFFRIPDEKAAETEYRKIRKKRGDYYESGSCRPRGVSLRFRYFLNSNVNFPVSEK